MTPAGVRTRMGDAMHDMTDIMTSWGHSHGTGTPSLLHPSSAPDQEVQHPHSAVYAELRFDHIVGIHV